MSKSKGNVVAPNDVAKKYGVEILRLWVGMVDYMGDQKISDDILKQMAEQYTNKLYNAALFLLMNEERFDDLKDTQIKSDLGRYLLSRLNVAVKETRENLDLYRFNDAATTLYRFLWGEFCDWGIELSKAQKESIKELGAIYKEALKLLHPFMPFISEYLYQMLSAKNLKDNVSIMIQKYPKFQGIDERIENIFSLIIEAVIAIRRAKANIDLANKKIEKAYIKLDEDIYFLKKEYLKLSNKDDSLDNLSAKYLVKLLDDTKDKLTIYYNGHKGLLTYTLGNISIPANSFLKANPDYDFFIDVKQNGLTSFRSINKVDVSLIAKELANGGGHSNASGCKIENFINSFDFEEIKKFVEMKFNFIN